MFTNWSLPWQIYICLNAGQQHLQKKIWEQLLNLSIMDGLNMRSRSPWYRNKITCDGLLLSKICNQCKFSMENVIFFCVYCRFHHRSQNYCKNCLEKVVLKNLIVWLFVGKGFFRKLEESDYLSPSPQIWLIGCTGWRTSNQGQYVWLFCELTMWGVVCVNSVSTVLRGASDNGMDKERQAIT